MEVKVDINSYQDDIDALKLNQILQQLEVYSLVHQIVKGQNISYTLPKLEGCAITWWEIHIEELRMSGDLPVTKWEDFKTLIKSHSYLIRYVEDQ